MMTDKEVAFIEQQRQAAMRQARQDWMAERKELIEALERAAHELHLWGRTQAAIAARRVIAKYPTEG